MRYPIAIELGDEQHAFGVTFPDVPGCFSAGDTLDEAIDNAKDALEGHLELCVEDGDPIPEASTITQHRDNPEFKDYAWAFVELDITPYLGKSHKVNVTLPEYIIKQIDHVQSIDKRYKNRSNFLAVAAMNELRRGKG